MRGAGPFDLALSTVSFEHDTGIDSSEAEGVTGGDIDASLNGTVRDQVNARALWIKLSQVDIRSDKLLIHHQ